MPNLITEVSRNANVRGLGSSNLATVELPVGETYSAIYLLFKAAGGTAVAVADIKSEITRIRLRADSHLLIDATPTLLFDLQKFYGDAYGADNVAGVLPLIFDRKHLQDILSRDVFLLGTANITSLTVEVQCGTLVNVATVEVYRETKPVKRNLVDHVRILPYNENFSTTGSQTVNTIPKRSPYGILAQHIEDSSGTIDDVTVHVDKTIIFDQVPAAVQQVRLEFARRNPQSGYYHLPYDQLEHRDGWLYMGNVQDYRLEIEWSSAAPNNYTIYQEELHNISPPMLGQNAA